MPHATLVFPAQGVDVQYEFPTGVAITMLVFLQKHMLPSRIPARAWFVAKHAWEHVFGVNMLGIKWDANVGNSRPAVLVEKQSKSP